jgi:hypothetical protein
MIALAPSGGSGDSHACCAAITRSVGREQRERATAVALAEHQAQRRRPQGHQVGQAARDLAGEAALLRLGRERRSGGVDHGHQRQPELDRQPHPASRLAQCPGTERVCLGLATPVLAQEDARCVTEARERDQQTGVALALTGAVERDHVGGAVLQQASYAGTLGTP